MSERVEGMAEEQKQAPAPAELRGVKAAMAVVTAVRAAARWSAARRRPGGGPAVPEAGQGKRQYFRKKKVCKFCVEKMDFMTTSARTSCRSSCRSAGRFCRGE